MNTNVSWKEKQKYHNVGTVSKYNRKIVGRRVLRYQVGKGSSESVNQRRTHNTMEKARYVSLKETHMTTDFYG